MNALDHAREPRGELWTPANIGDAAVALACVIGFLAWLALACTK